MHSVPTPEGTAPSPCEVLDSLHLQRRWQCSLRGPLNTVCTLRETGTTPDGSSTSACTGLLELEYYPYPRVEIYPAGGTDD